MKEATRLSDCPDFQDSLPHEPLLNGIKDNIEYLKKSSRPPNQYLFGARTVSKADYVASLEALHAKMQSHWNQPEFKNYIRENFECYEVYGGEKWGSVFVTSYFEPLLKASEKPTATLTQPLYKLPPNMVMIQMDEFFSVHPQLRENMKAPSEMRTPFQVLRGRIEKSKNPDEPATIRPYFDRKQIDQELNLKDQGLELAWVDPIDAFFLQIQGSGILEFPNGKRRRVGYAAQNGFKYEALGKFLTDVIPLEKMTLHTIESHLRTLSPQQIQSLLNKNPSYVFFRKLETKGVTYLGTEVIAKRTIASDQRFFQKGAIGYLEVEEPIFESESSTEAKAWVSKPRFIIDQDTGGAIRGGGRVDLFWGEGEQARQSAGVMKGKGSLVYLAPKAALIEKLQLPSTVVPKERQKEP
jgi:membrane-bound lytic murein transglycosylase A